MKSAYRYCASYCEENIWHLAQHEDFVGLEKRVVFASNESRACVFWNQKAAVDAQATMAWDYHVILLVHQGQWRVWDLDSRLPLGIAADDYLHSTFRSLHSKFARYEPHFRVLPWTQYVEQFHSDRSHMLDENGQWRAPPPAWNLITTDDKVSFMKWTEMKRTEMKRTEMKRTEIADDDSVLSLGQMLEFVTAPI